VNAGQGEHESKAPTHDNAAPPRAGWVATLRAVLWSFIGVRRRHDYDRDARSLDPRAVIVAGLLGGLIFVLTIVAVVRFVVSA
jgi:amino acid transporter